MDGELSLVETKALAGAVDLVDLETAQPGAMTRSQIVRAPFWSRVQREFLFVFGAIFKAPRVDKIVACCTGAMK